MTFALPAPAGFRCGPRRPWKRCCARRLHRRSRAKRCSSTPLRTNSGAGADRALRRCGSATLSLSPFTGGRWHGDYPRRCPPRRLRAHQPAPDSSSIKSSYLPDPFEPTTLGVKRPARGAEPAVLADRLRSAGSRRRRLHRDAVHPLRRCDAGCAGAPASSLTSRCPVASALTATGTAAFRP